MPRTKKAAGTTADPRNGRSAELQPVPRARVPNFPGGLRTLKRVSTRELWTAYWNDVISGLVQECEVHLVVRWVRNIDRYRVLMDAGDAEPIVAGSMGQLRENPAYGLALKLEASIRADEAQLGFGPKNRAALGIALVTAKGLDAMNRRYGGEDAGSDGAPEEEDPRRLTVVEGGAS
ncbi:MAG: P27 family phage terminase small subunit [Gammaproteobacteria bacterium]